MRIGILGAGAAGLSSAFFLKDHVDELKVFEAASFVGGLARSFEWHGFQCDIAPHRLYTNDDALLRALQALVPLHQLERRSRIFLRGKWIQDPVNPIEIILKYFPGQSLKIIAGYIRRGEVPEENFEALVLNQYGKGLNEIFFKPYSEKLFGIPANQISPAWGRRKLRVSGLWELLKRNSKLYFRHFYYPTEGGYGTICDRLYRAVESRVQLNTRVVGLEPIDQGHGKGPIYRCTLEHDGRTFTETFDRVISTLPVSVLTRMLGQPMDLRFREARLAYLLIDKPKVSKNHWFYFADADFIVNRVAEFKNFASAQAPEDRTVLCCEVTRTEDFSVERVIRELEQTGLIRRADVLDQQVVTIKHAYPIYDLDYEDRMAELADLMAQHPNLHLLGRHAQFSHVDVDEIFDAARSMAARFKEAGDLEEPHARAVPDALSEEVEWP